MAEELDPSYYRAILESLPTGVYVVDPERRILFWNDGAEQITGYRRHEIIGHRAANAAIGQFDDIAGGAGFCCALLHQPAVESGENALKAMMVKVSLIPARA